MTTFLIDIASFQAGEDISSLPDNIDGVVAKVTEGSTYLDPAYEGWRSAAAAAGLLLIPYHFLTQGSSTAAQVAWLKQNIGDLSLPIMLDVEVEGASKPTFADVIAFIDAATAAGLRIKLVYLPKWYWTQLGSPALTALQSRGVGLISSAYPRTAAAGALATYTADGGDAGEGWAPYGGVTPMLWQFGDDDPIQGRKNDINAYRGTITDLAGFLGASLPAKPPAPPKAVAPPTLKQGSTGTYVHQLQADLTAHGWTTSADSVFGALTESMTRAFQAYQGITVDGIVGPITWGRLAQPTGTVTTSEPALTVGAHGEPVERMQALLVAHACNPGGLDSEFGPATLAALKGFQASKKLAVDGVCGVLSWRALNN